jgi:hypothetical protein
MGLKKYNEFLLNESNITPSKSIDEVLNYLQKHGFGDHSWEVERDELHMDALISFKGKYSNIVQILNKQFGWFIYGYAADFEETVTDPEHMTVDGSDIDFNLGESEKDGYESDQEVFTILLRPKFPPKVGGVNVIYTIVDAKGYNPLLDGIKLVKSKSNIPDQILCSTKKKVEDMWQQKEYQDYEDVMTVAIDCTQGNIDLHMCSIVKGGIATYQEIPPENVIYAEAL